MAVDKVLEIDLSQLTTEGAQQLEQDFGELIETIEKKKKPTKKTGNTQQVLESTLSKRDQKIEDNFKKLTKKLEFESISQKGKNNLSNKLFGKQGLSNVISMARNPTSFIGTTLFRMLPVLGAAIGTTKIIADIIKRLDDFQKAFVDTIDDRIDVFRSKEQQASIQAGLTQLILTTSTGSAEPRDAYNTFDVFNNDQSRIETDFQIRNTSGVN